jgi:hypothetical protein
MIFLIYLNSIDAHQNQLNIEFHFDLPYPFNSLIIYFYLKKVLYYKNNIKPFISYLKIFLSTHNIKILLF